MGENNEELGFELDLDSTPTTMIPLIIEEEPQTKQQKVKKIKQVEEDRPVSCLRNEIITVKYIPKESGMVTNPKHIFYGGMAETATRTFTVPILESSRTFVNVLTNQEKTFLEEIMGLEPNALSIYLKNNNYWDNYSVRLTKNDKYLNLSDPDDYIKYKVLLANKDFICPSLATLSDNPRATYQFVLIAEKEESKESNKKLNSTMKAYELMGKLKENKRILKLIVETIDGRPISSSSEIEFIQGKAYDLITANAKLFVQVAEDPYLSTKVLISDCVENGLIRKRGDFLYLATNNEPLCESGEDPIVSVAAKYLNSPKHQEVKLSLEAKLKNLKD